MFHAVLGIFIDDGSDLGDQGAGNVTVYIPCRLEPMREAVRIIRNYLWEIINAVVLKVSKCPADSLNTIAGSR
ncbi:MAG: hypothetical protein OXH65_05910 [Paracoccaceae bacterium]|nr:hypothetical protein [Paracoccaceae bacterium]